MLELNRYLFESHTSVHPVSAVDPSNDLHLSRHNVNLLFTLRQMALNHYLRETFHNLKQLIPKLHEHFRPVHLANRPDILHGIKFMSEINVHLNLN